MRSPQPKRKRSTVIVGGVLVVALLIGTFLFGYVSLRLLLGGSDRGRVAQGPTATATVTATRTRTPTPTRTPVVIVAPTTVPFTPGPMPTGEAEGTPEPTVAGPSSGAQRTPTPTSAVNKGQGTGKLPQTGFGPGAPALGLMLAGMAGVARWLRQRS